MQIVQIVVLPKQAALPKELDKIIKKSYGEDVSYRVIKRSIDARKKQVKVNLKIELYYNTVIPELFTPKKYRKPQKEAEEVIVVGFGPAGMFAALKLIEQGLKPIVLERGKTIKDRRRDLVNITKNHIVNPESNYCFGEGGAGTFSDGKLYTRSKKRGDVNEILQILVQHGASEDILVDAHPHIGTNKLPKVVAAIRETIINNGGEIHFNTKLTDLVINNSEINGVEVNGEQIIKCKKVILATGHSSRDIFYLLKSKNIKIESKPFALGVRVEHEQRFIDRVQYHSDVRSEYLPPASYKLVHQVKGRGVFSFCMCPGGIIAPCATAPGEIVTNGWSPSKRNNKYANSGIVVSIDQQDLISYARYEELAGLTFQQEIEKLAYKKAGNSSNTGQIAPAQRLLDFTQNKRSNNLPDCSYIPGVSSVNLNEVLPNPISARLIEGFKTFNNKIKGFLTNDAIIVGVESRTSSPVKIPRDKQSLQHVQIKGLYPCGEGAGYAGGIVSAAIDGQKCAEKCTTI